ncbi:hypothetical protein [Thalassotalea montiporae]
MKLYNRKSYISSAPEGQSKESTPSKVTQWVYFVILAFMACYLLYLLIKPYFIISANGIVNIERSSLMSSYTGRISKLHIKETDEITSGQLIATLAPEKACLAENNKDLTKLQDDILVLTTKREALIKERTYIKSIISPSTAFYRALEINAELFREPNQNNILREKQWHSLGYEIEQLGQELNIMKQRLADLKQLDSQKPQDTNCMEKFIYAHEAALIAEIAFKESDYIKKGDILLNYKHTYPSVFITLFTSIELYQDIYNQPKLTVTFPDKSESIAKVKHIDSTLSLSPSEPTSSEDIKLKVILIPENNQDISLWVKHERMPVTVRGVR